MTDSLAIVDLLARALDAYDTLTSLGEDVEDEWSYVNDLSTAWRERIDGVASARGDEPASPATVTAVDRLIDEVGRITRSASSHRLAVDVPPGGAHRARGAAMRFQDAVKDARAVVYAGIQADPLVARAAGAAGRCERRSTGAGAGGHERRIDRCRWLAGDVPHPVRDGP